MLFHVFVFVTVVCMSVKCIHADILSCVNFTFQVVGGRERPFILGTHPIFVARRMGIRERGIAAVKPSAKFSAGFSLVCVGLTSFVCGWIACFWWLLSQPLDSSFAAEL